MKKLILAVTLAAAVLTLPSAYGVATLTITDGVVTVTVQDGGFNDINLGNGTVSYSGNVGANWEITITSGKSKGAVAGGTAAKPSMDLVSLVATSAGPGNLSIWFSDDNFGTLPAGSTTFASHIGGTTDGTVTLSTYGDANNAINGTTTPLSVVGPFAGPSFSGGSSASTAAFAGDSAYSLTMVAAVQHTAEDQSTSFNATLRCVPDGGSTLLLLGSALGFLGFANWRRQK
jgi:hypothetical protein